MNDPKFQPWPEPDLQTYLDYRDRQSWKLDPATRPFTAQEFAAFKQGVWFLYRRSLQHIGTTQFTAEMIEELPLLLELIDECRDIDGLIYLDDCKRAARERPPSADPDAPF
jgi:hypothetical protein